MSDLYEIAYRKDGKPYYLHARRLKRAERRASASDPCYDAHCHGWHDGERGKYNNRYPPGKRRDNYDASYEHARMNAHENGSWRNRPDW